MSDYVEIYGHIDTGTVVRVYDDSNLEPTYDSFKHQNEEEYFELLSKVLESYNYIINETPKRCEGVYKAVIKAWGCNPIDDLDVDSNNLVLFGKIVEAKFSWIHRNLPVSIDFIPTSNIVRVQCFKPYKYSTVHDVTINLYDAHNKPNVELAIILYYLSLPFIKRGDYDIQWRTNTRKKLIVPYSPTPPFFACYSKEGFDMEEIVEGENYQYDVDNLHTWLVKNVEPLIEDYLKLCYTTSE